MTTNTGLSVRCRNVKINTQLIDINGSPVSSVLGTMSAARKAAH